MYTYVERRKGKWKGRKGEREGKGKEIGKEKGEGRRRRKFEICSPSHCHGAGKEGKERIITPISSNSPFFKHDLPEHLL